MSKRDGLALYDDESKPDVSFPPVLIVGGGLLSLTAILIAGYFRSEFYIAAVLLFFPIFYSRKTVALSAFVLSFSYALPLLHTRLDFRADDIMFFVLSTIWVMDALLSPGQSSRPAFLKRVLIAWLVINFLSIVVNLPGYDGKQVLKSAYYLFRTTQYVFVFFIVSDMIKNRFQKTTLLRLLWLNSIIIALYAVYQVNISGERLATSTLSYNHVHLGVYIALTFFVLIGYLLSARHLFEKISIVLTLPLLLYALYLSASRTGIVAVLFGTLVLIMAANRKYAWIVLTILAGVVILYGRDLLIRIEHINVGLAEFENLEGNLSFMARFYMWLGVYKMVAGNPHILLTGVGLGAFLDSLYPYVPLLPFGMANAAHNHYLHHLVETGVAGLGVFVYMLVVLLRTSYRRFRNRAVRDRALYLGYFGGLAALAVSGLSQDTLSVMEMAMWNFLGYFFLVTAVVFREPEEE